MKNSYVLVVGDLKEPSTDGYAPKTGGSVFRQRSISCSVEKLDVLKLFMIHFKNQIDPEVSDEGVLVIVGQLLSLFFFGGLKD